MVFREREEDYTVLPVAVFFFSSRRRHTRFDCDWSSDVCSSDLDACRKDPLARAVRSDKFTLAALEATLALYREPATSRREIPVLRMLTEDVEQIRQRAETLHKGVGRDSEIVEGESEVGGGSFPGVKLKTWLLRLNPPQLAPDTLAGGLRSKGPPLPPRPADGPGGPRPPPHLPCGAREGGGPAARPAQAC